MDRNSIVGYLLIFLIFAGYLVYTSKDAAELQKQQAVKDSIALANQPIDTIAEPVFITEEQSVTETLLNQDVVEQDSNQAESAIPEEEFSIENAFLKVDLTSKGGRISSVELKQYKRSDSTDLILFNKDGSQFEYTIPFKSGVVQTSDLDFKVSKIDSTAIVLVHEVDGGQVEQHYNLDEKYGVQYSLKLIGLEQAIARKHTSLDLNWTITAPLQERSLEDERNLTTIYYKYLNESGVDYLSERSYEEKTLQTNIHWVSFKQKFFMSTLIFPNGLLESGTNIATTEVTSDDEVEHMASSFSIPFGHDREDVQSFEFYFGPNHYQTLKRKKIGLEKTISLGWGIIGWVNKFLIIPIFNWLSNFISNYGIIILLLTLIIKLALIAPMYKIYVSSAKMKLLKPELEELKKKTGGDMQKQQQEQMKLYKKAGVSPFGGCLPQLIQFPILIAMFRFFPASIELRQKSFLWATDLSTYDSVYNFPNGFEIPLYGDHISLFTILMALSSLLYTMYNAQSTGLSGQMKYIMYLMPVMLLVWFNSYSSGLSYYYFLANIITFGQNFVFKTWVVDEAKLHKQMEANKKKKGNPKKSGFQKKLEEMAKKRGVDPKNMKRK